MATGHFIILIETDPRWSETLATQLVRLGVESIRVSEPQEALDIVKSRQYAISAVLVPSEIPVKTLRKTLTSIRRREPALPAMAYGKIPDRTQRRELRQAGVLYSVSAGGCFIDSPRASMDGAQLQTLFVLEERSFDLEGVVAFTNVPGNLQRPNLPLGMGVQFQDIPEAVGQSLAEFIRNRIESLEV